MFFKLKELAPQQFKYWARNPQSLREPKHAPKRAGWNSYGCLDRLPSVQIPGLREEVGMSTIPVLPGFSETLCEKLPTILPRSNNIMCITTWFHEIQQIAGPSSDTQFRSLNQVFLPELLCFSAVLRPALDVVPSQFLLFFTSDHLLEMLHQSKPSIKEA